MLITFAWKDSYRSSLEIHPSSFVPQGGWEAPHVIAQSRCWQRKES